MQEAGREETEKQIATEKQKSSERWQARNIEGNRDSKGGKQEEERERRRKKRRKRKEEEEREKKARKEKREVKSSQEKVGKESMRMVYNLFSSLVQDPAPDLQRISKTTC